MNENQDERDAAQALLETKRHVMTGREIEICERMLKTSLTEESEILADMIEDESTDYLEAVKAEDDLVNLDDDIRVFKSVCLQFSREIGEWIADRDRSASRRTVETHNRLHPQAA